MSFLTRFILEFFRLSMNKRVCVELILTVNKESQIRNAERIGVKSKREFMLSRHLYIFYTHLQPCC